jgi:hypothetical protein
MGKGYEYWGIRRYSGEAREAREDRRASHDTVETTLSGVTRVEIEQGPDIKAAITTGEGANRRYGNSWWAGPGHLMDDQV